MTQIGTTGDEDIEFMNAEFNLHFLVFGTTGRGKSLLPAPLALNAGASPEEAIAAAGSMAARTEPNADGNERKGLAMEPEKGEQRLQAVREAYWAASEPEEFEFGQLHDVLIQALDLNEDVNDNQVKAAFMMLPAKIIGDGIKWGFDDTEVGDACYRWAKENRDAVLAAMGPGAANTDRDDV